MFGTSQALPLAGNPGCSLAPRCRPQRAALLAAGPARPLQHPPAVAPQAAASSSSSNGATASSSGPAGPSGSLAPDFFREGREAAARQQLFDNIAPVYDQLNDRLSLGLHRVWKRMTVKWARAAPGGRVLDVCCGSGDLSFLLAEAVGPEGQVRGAGGPRAVWAGQLVESCRRREWPGRKRQHEACYACDSRLSS